MTDGWTDRITTPKTTLEHSSRGKNVKQDSKSYRYLRTKSTVKRSIRSLLNDIVEVINDDKGMTDSFHMAECY